MTDRLTPEREAEPLTMTAGFEAAIRRDAASDLGLGCQDGLCLLAEIDALRAERDDLQKTNDEWSREATRIGQKLMEGTMHCLVCNGDHNAKVGASGLICNCPPGQEIKALRHEVAALTADKDRLDWLIASPGVEIVLADRGYWVCWPPDGVTHPVVGSQPTFRAAIDLARAAAALPGGTDGK